MQKPIIETKRLILRKLQKGDAFEIFNNWANDDEVTKYVTWNTHKDISVTEQILDYWLKEYDNPKTIRYGITIKETGELVGSIDVVHYIDNIKPEVGYCLSRKCWNKGYMTEVCNAFVDYLFSLGYQEVVIEADVNNIASNKVIQKCGFIFTHQETREISSFKPGVVTVNWYKKTLR